MENIRNIYNLILDECTVIDDFQYFNQTVEEFFKKDLGFFDTLYILIVRDLKIKMVSFDEHFDNREGIIRIN